MKSNKGFTLIELVVVITILGILAATALPRFVGLQRDARVAKLNAARAAVLSASAMIAGAAQARADQAQPACLGTAVTTIVNGTGTLCTQVGLINIVNWNATASLPGAVPGGIVDAAGLTSTFPATQAALNLETYATNGAGGANRNSTINIRVMGGTNAANCSFNYTPSTGNVLGSAATVSIPVITGC